MATQRAAETQRLLTERCAAARRGATARRPPPDPLPRDGRRQHRPRRPRGRAARRGVALDGARPRARARGRARRSPPPTSSDDLLTTALGADEILTAVELPAPAAARRGLRRGRPPRGRLRDLRRGRAGRARGRLVTDVRAGALRRRPTPVRATAAEARLRGGRRAEAAIAAAAAGAARADPAARDDLQAPAGIPAPSRRRRRAAGARTALERAAERTPDHAHRQRRRAHRGGRGRASRSPTSCASAST